MKQLLFVCSALLFTPLFYFNGYANTGSIESYGDWPLTKTIGSTVDDIESETEIVDSKINKISTTIDIFNELEQIQSQCPTIISQADLPLTITEPGKYVACENLTFNPVATNETAITIASNYVTLDFNNKSLSQGNTINATNAIKINPSHHNISIKNGALSEFTGSASANSSYIYAENNNYALLLDSLKISGHATLTANGNGKAIFLNATHSSIIHNCTISSFRPSGIDSSDTIVLLNDSATIKITTSTIDNNYSGSKQFSALALSNTSSCSISESTFNNNRIFSSTDAYVISVEDSNNINMHRCSCNGNNNIDGNLSIINLVNTNACSVQNCNITYNQANSAGKNLFAIYQESSNGSVVQNCIINRNNAENNASSMQLLSCTDNLIQNCEINYTSANNAATGINIESCTSTSITNCVSSYNDIGIAVDSTSAQPILDSITIYNNTLYGVYNDSTTAVITSCTTNGNGMNFASSNDFQPKTILPRNNIEYGSNTGTDAFDKKDGIIYIPAQAIENTGLTINEPGHYILTEPVNFDGTSASTAITINADYVTFDLNNYALENINTNADVSAITINEGNHNITVKNGFVSGFTGNSIFINQNCYNITLNSLSLIGRAPITESTSAITINGSDSNYVKNLTLENCAISKFNPPSSQALFSSSYVNDLNVMHCSFNQNSLNDTTPNQKVIAINNSNNCQLTNCSCSGNTGFGIQHILEIDTCHAIHVNNCVFNSNAVGNAGNVIIIKNSQGPILRKCKINNNEFLTNNDAAPSNCIQIYNCDGCEINSCKITSNIADTETVTVGDLNGILLATCTSCYIHNSVINNLSGRTLSTANVNGINIINSESCKIFDNFLMDIRRSNGTVTTANGIFIDSSTNHIIQNCTVFRCNGTGITNDSSTTCIWGNESLFCGAAWGGTHAPSVDFGASDYSLVPVVGYGSAPADDEIHQYWNVIQKS